MKQKVRASILAISTIFAFSVAPVAASFNSGFIISDEELFATNTMSAQDIQVFLNEHDGVLKTYTDLDIDGLLKTAAMIISSAAERHQINPQVLLVKLQKEMGLITDSTPKQSQFDWAMGYGVCDNCSVNHPSVLKYKGFAKQVDNAAEFFAYVANSQEKFFYKAGGTYTISGEEVTIANNVTAALYNYTPHIHGNEIFYSLWQKWFANEIFINYPSGTLAQVQGEPGIWLIENGVKHAFTNFRAFSSRYATEQVVSIQPAILDQYPTGAPIELPEFALVQTNSGAIYLIVHDELRLIEDEQVFRSLGFTVDELVDVDDSEIAYFSQGTPITAISLDPLGALVQDPNSFGIYFVKDGIKYPLTAPELLSMNFAGMKARKGTVEELDRYIKGAPVLLHDGYLVKSANSASVYVIANGKRHEIDSEYTFNSLGYQWNRIQTISQGLLDLHPPGEVLQVLPPVSDDLIDAMMTDTEL